MGIDRDVYFALDIYNTEYTLEDISELEDVDFVMKGGVVYKSQ